MQSSLKGINNRAIRNGKHRFGGLYRLLNVENLHWAYSQLNKKAAVGVDKVSHREYGLNLKENLENLNERLKNKTYKAKLIRRHYIPKSPGKMRPLGIPAIEDKIVQYAAAKILENIYEADFIESSYGYRPRRGAKDAVDEASKLGMFGGFNFVVEADIKGFFDNIDHDWLLKMIAHRVDDKAFVALIRKWLKAGILEDGIVENPKSGTPQGGVISPVLANIYLHYALDLWFEMNAEKYCQGKAKIIRYADDFICFFEYKSEAENFYQKLPQRLAKFKLEVAPEKTKILLFSCRWHPDENGSFEFLGFEFRWRFSRKGQPYALVRTAPKRQRKAIKTFADWLRKNRSRKLRPLMEEARRKMQGHYNYYGRAANGKALSTYWHHCKRYLFKWLNRRSQKRSYNWEGFTEMLKYFRLDRPVMASYYRQAEPDLNLKWSIKPKRK